MPLSLYTRNAWLNHLFGGDAMPVPSAWYVQLHYDDPGVNCTDNAWVAPTGPARQAATWTSATAKANATVSAVTWTSLPDPGTNSWMTWISVWDAVSGGNPLGYGQLGSPALAVTGGTLTADAGAITNAVTS